MSIRVGVCALIVSRDRVLLGKRGKDPNRGLYVLPGGGVEDGESFDQALRREVREETGLEIVYSDRWTRPYVIELPAEHRIILAVTAVPMDAKCLRGGSDLYDVSFFGIETFPKREEISPVVLPILNEYGWCP
jgi:8-oxo-dGTP diphosphatase